MSSFPLPLNAAGVCASCERGEHGLCRNAACTCTVGAEKGRFAHHKNRPHTKGGRAMNNPAPVTPIDRNTEPKQSPLRKGEVTLGLKKVDKLPDLVRNTLTDRVIGLLRDAELDDGWYQLIEYPNGKTGTGVAVSRLSKDARLADYEFAGRGQFVYVRLKTA